MLPKAEVLPHVPSAFPLSAGCRAGHIPTLQIYFRSYKPPNPHIHPLEQLHNQRHVTPHFLHHAADSLQRSPILQAKPAFYGQNLPYAERTDRCWFRHVGRKQLPPPTHSTAGTRRDQTASPSYFPFIISLPFGSLHPHANILNPFLPTGFFFSFFFPQQPVDMPLELIYSLIYSTASATSLVNLFHMFIPLCVKQGCASSPLSLGPFIFRRWPQLPCPTRDLLFCSSEQKSSSERVQGDARDMPALCQP